MNISERKWSPADQTDWKLCCRNFNRPRSLTICPPASYDYGVTFADYAVEAKLDLVELSQIFVAEPDEFYDLSAGERPIQPTAESYESLGCLAVDDSEGFSRLACLVGKAITLIHECRYDSDSSYYRDVARYTSDGAVDRSLIWVEFLQPYIESFRQYLAKPGRQQLALDFDFLMSCGQNLHEVHVMNAYGSVTLPYEDLEDNRHFLMATIFAAEINALYTSTFQLLSSFVVGGEDETDEIEDADRDLVYRQHATKCAESVATFVAGLPQYASQSNEASDIAWLMSLREHRLLR